MYLSDCKPGDKVTLQHAYTKVIGTVIKVDSNLTLLAWEKDDKHTWHLAWNIDTGARLERGDIPIKYTDAYWFGSDKECEIVPVISTAATIGFLTACITAGAGLSRITSATVSKETKETIRVVQ